MERGKNESDNEYGKVIRKKERRGENKDERRKEKSRGVKRWERKGVTKRGGPKQM